MSKYLVIIESPGKLKKIKSYLGKDYEVIASYGHVSDLPKKGLNVDIKKDFKPTYEISNDKKDVVKNIIQKAKKAERVYLFTDGDREGSAIAFHISNYLPKDIEVLRVKSGSITKDAVINAIKDATTMDSEESLIDSYETRRIIDRIAGYKMSFPTKQATGGQSAGRVQSAGLRILAEREKEIQSFVPQEYWPIDVILETSKGEKITFHIKKPPQLEVANKERADEIISVITKGKWVVSEYESSKKSNRAFPPFTTSSLYQSASSILGWGSKKTSSIAQDLYESGSITYIRSDSTFIIPEFISEIRGSISNNYCPEYLPSSCNVFSNSKNAQEAHEAIRITQIAPESNITRDHRKLYEIIRKRTIASQMSNMRQLATKVEVVCEDFVFGANASKIVFDGWRKLWDYGSYMDTEIPELKVGEKLKFIEAKTEQKFTIPPSRYTEASFIKELEKRGIGRPSTYKSIIEVLQNRKYVEIEKKSFVTTEMGIRVSDFLVKANVCFVDLNFTATLESDLDKIAHNEVGKLCVLRNFWDRLKRDMENAKTIRQEESLTEYDCPKCENGKLVKKHSRYGPFYTCSNRTTKEIKCDYKCSVGENQEPVEVEKKELEESDFLCPNCDSPLVKRTSKKGWVYLACRNWAKDEKCKGFFDQESGKEIVFKTKKKWGKK